MANIYGYMRISTLNESQKFDRQEAQLKDCNHIYRDRISGSKRERPALNALLEDLQEGDTVLIVSIDRLSRSTKDLLAIVEVIDSKGACLKSINDSWLDTSSDNPMNEFLLTVMGGLATMERKQIQSRVKEGVAVAQSKGVQFGRPKARTAKVELALELYSKREHTVKEIAEITGLSRATIYNKLKEKGS
ncbi:recombinase family protein [Salinicoccus roseus]|uniref:recombinase family protein n=1 Tax=Salinicoccus roseus TaxID=45670 RepID=UPI001CA71B59|nr:recombinase family protein [Salinicoccus roseus]MBY8908873.1 recombinase family protein [Salinicoccus roseus]